MNKNLRLSVVFAGLIFISLGSYLWVVESMIQREFVNLQRGTANVTDIQSLAEYPLIQKDIVLYNVDLAHIYKSNKPAKVAEHLLRLLVESDNRKLRFQACLLLAHIYTNTAIGGNAERNMMAAIGMYIAALKIKPDDLFAKLSLERLLDQMKKQPSRRVENRVKQALPKNPAQSKGSRPGDKGEDI